MSRIFELTQFDVGGRRARRECRLLVEWSATSFEQNEGIPLKKLKDFKFEIKTTVKLLKRTIFGPNGLLYITVLKGLL